MCFEENKKMLRELKDARKNVANEENIEMQLIRSLLLNEELEMILNQGLEDFDEEYTYEELLQLGDQIGKVSKGLSEEQISLLPSEVLKTPENCSICLVDMSVRSLATRLSPCGHLYHIECIKTWLTENKTCPLCLQEITI